MKHGNGCDGDNAAAEKREGSSGRSCSSSPYPRILRAGTAKALKLVGASGVGVGFGLHLPLFWVRRIVLWVGRYRYRIYGHGCLRRRCRCSGESVWNFLAVERCIVHLEAVGNTLDPMSRAGLECARLNLMNIDDITIETSNGSVVLISPQVQYSITSIAQRYMNEH
jgi:hypothetical protein